ncbi:SRPBCC domain-containing protein [Luteitalea sp.]|uniref:SRPBCC domain-containing protein n=1 Tax=Luteitalea sp. TaxID=2004800 RepID=UPI0025BFAA1E|nr:SRPBCC domain-containing protein [Luteitalea sp.]
MSAFPHQLDRALFIRARRDTVFSFFTDSARWAAWWGEGSSIDPQIAGRVFIRHPNGVEVHGEIVEIAAPGRIVFTYATPGGQPVASLVTIRLDEHPEGTMLHLSHAFDDAAARDAHVQGWRYQLSVFANRVSDIVLARAEAIVDSWFEAWNDGDAARRDHAIGQLASPAVAFHDRYSCVTSLDDLRAHLAAIHRFMPGMRVARTGVVRQCQWRAIAEWTATGPDGAARGAGTNVFEFDADGRVAKVTGFWA